MTANPVILIVDDEPANISIMAAALDDNYEICFACNGAEALRIATQIRPSLILLDVMMPGEDGYSVCRSMKSEPALRDIPIIFTTALTAAENELQGLTAGAIDYVTKPIQPQLLQRRVENHIALHRLRDQLTQQALIDPLTGLDNRRVLDSRLPEEIRRLGRELSWMSVMMVDIDHFKQFNDHYGHPAGDDALKQVGQALRATLTRAADGVVRYGGEEFACLLPETDGVGARLLGEKMRRRVESLAIPHAQSKTSSVVTISIGAASARCEPDGRPALWISEADRMLYESKRSRNRVSAVTFDLRNFR